MTILRAHALVSLAEIAAARLLVACTAIWTRRRHRAPEGLLPPLPVPLPPLPRRVSKRQHGPVYRVPRAVPPPLPVDGDPLTKREQYELAGVEFAATWADVQEPTYDRHQGEA